MKKEEIKFGWSPSKLDGTEFEFEGIQNYEIPEEYSYINYLPEVENQGSTNMCVTYSISAHLDWNCNVDNRQDNRRNNHINKKEIYAVRNTPGDNGMTFKEALSFMKHKGVSSDLGNLKIESYMMIKSELALKQALLLNGPCIGGLYIKNFDKTDFWNGTKNYGGHAISIVGYTKKGFIIRNSWGKSWGQSGYAILKYADFNKILECWTIVD
ncbi:hypothetical protein IKN40_00175 [bacterium]|nr:hypothetical protein [bacterium]